MTPDQKIALILEANDNATAVLQKVRKELGATSDAAGSGAGHFAALTKHAGELGESDFKIRRASRAIGEIAYAAEEARLSSRGAVFAIGEIATAGAEVTPALAEWAIPIGAAVALLGTFISVLDDTKEETQQVANFQQHLGRLTESGIRNAYAAAKDERDKALQDVEDTADSFWDRMLHRTTVGASDLRGMVRDIAYSFGYGVNPEAQSRLNVANDDLHAAFEARQQAAQQDRVRILNLGDQTRELARQKANAVALVKAQADEIQNGRTALDLDLARARSQKASDDAAVEAMFRRRDAAGNLVALTDEELAQRGRLLADNRRQYEAAVALAQVQDRERLKGVWFSANAAYARALAVRDGDTFKQQQAALDEQLQQQLISLQNQHLARTDQDAIERKIWATYRLQTGELERQRQLANEQAKADIDVNSTSAGERYKGRLELIKAERDAAIRSGIDRVTAERRAQQQIRQAQRDAFTEWTGNLQTIEDATIHSHSRQIRAIGTFAQTFRRLAIGADGAHSAVLALKEGAAAIGSAAVGDFRGAALHALSATQYAAAAAKAAQESLGGSSGASGGGAGGGANSAGVFQPGTGSGNAGGTTINLITRDPYGRDAIQQTMYYINRSQLLGRPVDVAVPPTAGFSARAA